MRRLFLVGSLLLVCGAAGAAAYDDYARGVSADTQGDSATAITSFSAALAAGDLSASLQPAAYFGRAVAYLRTGKCAVAVADLDAALALKSDTWDAQLLRGQANICIGKFDAALADFSAVIAARPAPDAWRARAKLRWRTSDFSGAAADFAELVKLQPKFAYNVVWLALLQERAGGLAQAGLASAMADVDDWPAPILSLISGKSKPDAVEAAAAQSGGQAAINRQCEADFYVAEWWLAQKDAASAKPLLGRAVANCPHNLVAYGDARIELARQQ